MIVDITTPAWTEETLGATQSRFTITPLFPGYGPTVGNAIRRVLLSSLPGASLVSVQFEGATHEFSTLPGVKEDVVELTLNLKALRLQLHSDGPVELSLSKKGPSMVTAADFKKSDQVDIKNPDLAIATLDKDGSLSLTVQAERGRGYQTVEQRSSLGGGSTPLGTIALDALYSPVTHVEMQIEDTRVGQMTNYDKLALIVTTDGTTAPKEAFQQAMDILTEQFESIRAQSKGEASAPVLREAAAGPRMVPDETVIQEAGLTPKIAKILETGGFITVGAVRDAAEEAVLALEGLTERNKQEIRLLRGQREGLPTNAKRLVSNADRES